MSVAKRFVSDQCTVRAASHTFTSLLALVPLLAISFAIFAAFDDMRIKVQAYILKMSSHKWVRPSLNTSADSQSKPEN
jgi:uncharacterized BrkB/YihY/UPF0761 family membrane protein